MSTLPVPTSLTSQEDIEKRKITIKALGKIAAYYFIALVAMLLGSYSNKEATLENFLVNVLVCGLLCLPTAYFYGIHTLLYKTSEEHTENVERIIQGIYAIAITFGTFYVLDIILNVIVVDDSQVMLSLKFFILSYCSVFFLCAFFYRRLFSSRTSFMQYKIVRYQLLIPSLITVGLSYYVGYVIQCFFADTVDRTLIMSLNPFYPVLLFVAFQLMIMLGKHRGWDKKKIYVGAIASIFFALLILQSRRVL